MSLQRIPEDAVTIKEETQDHATVKRNGLTDRNMALRYIAQAYEMKEEDLRIEDTGPGMNLCRVSPRTEEAAAAFKAAVARRNNAR